MGLDGIELIMAVEEEFDIEIMDDEAEHCRRVQNLTELVYKKVKDRPNMSVSEEAEYKNIRMLLSKELGIPISEITMKTELRKMIPHQSRRKTWQNLQQTFKPGSLPDLGRSERCIKSLIFIILLATVAAMCFWGIIWGLVAAIAIWLLCLKLTKPLKIHFPLECTLVEDLSYYSFDPKVKASFHTKADVDWLVKCIIVEQLGLQTKQVKDHARFFEDLGCD